MNNLPQLKVRLLFVRTATKTPMCWSSLAVFFDIITTKNKPKQGVGVRAADPCLLDVCLEYRPHAATPSAVQFQTTTTKQTNRQNTHENKQKKNETNLYLSQIKDSCGFGVLFCFVFPFIYFYFFPKDQSSWNAPVNFLSGQQEDLLLWLLFLLFFFTSSFFFWFFILWSIPVYFYALGENSSHLAV